MKPPNSTSSTLPAPRPAGELTLAELRAELANLRSQLGKVAPPRGMDANSTQGLLGELIALRRELAEMQENTARKGEALRLRQQLSGKTRP